MSTSRRNLRRLGFRLEGFTFARKEGPPRAPSTFPGTSCSLLNRARPPQVSDPHQHPEAPQPGPLHPFSCLVSTGTEKCVAGVGQYPTQGLLPRYPAADMSAAAAADEGQSSILSETNVDTPGFRWVSLRKILWRVRWCNYGFPAALSDRFSNMVAFSAAAPQNRAGPKKNCGTFSLGIATPCRQEAEGVKQAVGKEVLTLPRTAPYP